MLSTQITDFIKKKSIQGQVLTYMSSEDRTVKE